MTEGQRQRTNTRSTHIFLTILMVTSSHAEWFCSWVLLLPHLKFLNCQNMLDETTSWYVMSSFSSISLFTPSYSAACSVFSDAVSYSRLCICSSCDSMCGNDVGNPWPCSFLPSFSHSRIFLFLFLFIPCFMCVDLVQSSGLTRGNSITKEYMWKMRALFFVELSLALFLSFRNLFISFPHFSSIIISQA